MNLTNYILIGIGVIVLGGFWYSAGPDVVNVSPPDAPNVVLGASVTGGSQAAACTATTSTYSLLTTSSEILATSSNRAWASIQVPANSRAPAYFSFSKSAVVGEGIGINTVASTSDTLEVGLNTSFASTQAINGIGTIAQQLLITQCVY